MAIGLVAVVSSGCSRSVSVPMSGAVTLNDQPVNQGIITLSPTDLAVAPATGSAITDGRYDIPAAQGPHRGVTYRVEISAVDRSHATRIGEFVPDSIPPAYNRDSKLMVTIPDDVGQFAYDFKLTAPAASRGR
jgi:hypothetical protein